jgi:hypothetical protein
MGITLARCLTRGLIRHKIILKKTYNQAALL